MFKHLPLDEINDPTLNTFLEERYTPAVFNCFEHEPVFLQTIYRKRYIVHLGDGRQKVFSNKLEAQSVADDGDTYIEVKVKRILVQEHHYD